MRYWRPLVPLAIVVVLGSPFTGRLGHVWRALRDRAHFAVAHPVAFALTCVALVVSTLVAGALRRRRWWRSHTLAHAPIAACDPYALGVKRSFLADKLAHDGTPAPYFARDLDRRIAAHVGRAGDDPLDRLVLIVGQPLAGKSRTAFETVAAHFPDATVIVPRRRRASARQSPAAEILRTRRRLGRARRHVLWLDDLGALLTHEHADMEDVVAWLARHRRAWVVATAERSAEGLAAERGGPGRPPFVLRHELSDEELAAARSLYGPASSRRLPKDLVEGEPVLHRLADGATAHPTGAAIVRAAVACVRCRPGRPVTQALLRRLHATYLPAGVAVAESFEDGLAWAATADEDGEPALRKHGENAPTYEVASALIDRADREAEPLHDDTWNAVFDDSANDVEALLAVADAARDRGRPDLASAFAHQVVSRFDDARASELLIALADAPPAAPHAERARPAAPRAALGANPFRLRPPAAAPSAAWLYTRPVLRSVLRVAVLATGDVLAVTAAVASMLALRTLLFGPPPHGLVWSMTHFGAIAAAGSLGALATAKLYTEDAQRAYLPAIVSAAALVATGCVIVGLANGLDRGGYAVIVASALLAIPAVYGLRHLYDVVSRAWIVRCGLQSRTVLVSEPEHAYKVGAVLAHSSTRPLTLLGFVGEVDAPGRLGTVSELGGAIPKHSVQRVVLADPDMSRERQIEIADLCHRRDVRVDLMPCAAELQLLVGAAHPRRAPGPVPVPPLRLSIGAALVKTLFDLTLGLVLLLALLVPMAAIAVAIMLTSQGRPIVAVQCPGRGEAPFRLKRFRTSAVLPPMGAGNEPDGSDDDPQPTRLGRWLQRYRLDELPQLFNVLGTDMSLVGPRPLPLAEFERLEAWHRKRYLFTPGLTGEWQLSSRRTDLDGMARVDLAYMAGWSFARDVAIVLKTPLALLRLGRSERDVAQSAVASV